MKRFFVIVLSIFYLLLNFAPNAQAHLAGQPPFFKINGKFAAQYNVASTSLQNFPLPQDIGVDRYLVNTPIMFHIMSEMLGIPEDIATNTTYLWDFGDGKKAKGIDNTHVYVKGGSYTVSIEAQYRNDPPVLIESVLLQVLPFPEYKLPSAQMIIGGVIRNDPMVDTITLPFGKTLSFDATPSQGGSAKIMSYWWDFGDGFESHGQKAAHSYDPNGKTMFPLLRVVDENGFISDNFLQINNENMNEAESAPSSNSANLEKSAPKTIIPQILILGIATFVVGCLILYRKK